MTDTITWDDFQKIELKIGTVVRAEEFPEARNPAYKVWVDFGEELGIKKTSAQITVHYKPEELIGRQIVGVVNFPVMQIGPIKSEFLLTGFYDEDGAVVMAQPERPVPNGAKLV
ncbi:MAG: tRNA-binding protein [Emcibacteraceae bacterium]|nr:tRNA-binding protein [Emcibacteraceae bacterium]MDG1995675.1 tRNA-binding protein [Emcibacteraceae bacterium]